MSSTSTDSMQELFFQSSSNKGMLIAGSGGGPSSFPPAGTIGYYGPAFTADERLLVDPLLKRNTWYKSYVNRVKVWVSLFISPCFLLIFKILQEDKSEKSLARDRNKYSKQQFALAEDEIKAINEFEKHLILAKLKV
jgi:hypothetical protein